MNLDFSFGRIAVDGQICNSDIKIVRGRLIPDWWRKSGHSVVVEDVLDILDSGSTIVVIGTGQPGYMKVSETLQNHFKENKIELIIAKTSEAVGIFSRLMQEGKPVSGGFHVGC